MAAVLNVSDPFMPCAYNPASRSRKDVQPRFALVEGVVRSRARHPAQSPFAPRLSQKYRLPSLNRTADVWDMAKAASQARLRVAAHIVSPLLAGSVAQRAHPFLGLCCSRLRSPSSST